MTNQRTEEVTRIIEVNGVELIFLKITDSLDFSFNTVTLHNENPELATIYLERTMTREHMANMRNGIVNEIEFSIQTTSWGSLTPDELQAKVDIYQETIATVQKLKLELDRYQLQLNLQKTEEATES